MKYNDNGEYKDIYVKAFDTLPVGTEVDYDGSVVPSGWTEIPDPNTYSTDEVRVGTWIDGKPLYRKVVTATITHPASTTTVETYEINHNISNAQSIFIDYGTTYSNGSSILNTFYNVSQGKFTYWSRARIDINKIYYDLYYNSYSIDTENLIITILYTKTTD